MPSEPVTKNPFEGAGRMRKDAEPYADFIGELLEPSSRVHDWWSEPLAGHPNTQRVTIKMSNNLVLILDVRVHEVPPNNR